MRVVRLSFVEGTVGILLPDASEWAEASINTPIEQGYELATQKGSFAEVQFENASTLRLGELSDAAFDRLDFSDSGRRVTSVHFIKGYGTVHAFSSLSGKFQVTAGGATITPEGGCEFRIDRDDQSIRIEVWSGGVDFSGPLGNVELAENQALTFAPGSGEPYDIESGLTPDDWDRWVAQRDQAEAAQTQPQAVNPSLDGSNESGNLYGWSDLATYGSWTYYSDIGYAWCPYATFGWIPYSFGRWVWYPGFGYTWVSSEPWGWLPYHYGQWAYEPGTGWAWVPHSFASWSPALVNWYQGPGWVGWTPQWVAGLSGAGSPCPAMSQGCFRAMTVKKFQDGAFITPQGTLAVNPRQGRRVNNPDIPASALAMLPGAPLEVVSGGVGRAKRQGGPVILRAAGGPSGLGAEQDNAKSHRVHPGFDGRSAPAASLEHDRPSGTSSAFASSPSSSHFTGARAPRSAPSPTRVGDRALGGVGALPVTPLGSPHASPAAAPGAAHASPH